MPSRGRPLDAHPALRSNNVTEIEHVLAATYGARRFELIGAKEKLNVHANHWQSESISLSFCHYGARVNVDFPEAGFFRQQFSLRGGAHIKVGGTEREIGTNAFCVVPPDSRLLIRFQPGFEQLVLRVDQAQLEGKFAALAGKARSRIEFDLAARPGTVATARLSRLPTFFISELDRQEGMTAIEIAEMEQAILVAFLQANPTADQSTLNGSRRPAGYRQMRILEEYIEAHWNEPLSLEALSIATAVGTRTIFNQFQKWRGKTPMQFIKEVRLRHAREMLRRNPGVTITEIAISCGFGNLGHFAADYRRCWGKRPSDTRAALGRFKTMR